MPNRAPWEAGYACGHDLIDAQHQAMLTACDALADLCEPVAGDAHASRFDEAFVQWQKLAREHFEAEAGLLEQLASPQLEDHRFECEEFEYLLSEIVSTEHFDRLELQRFLAQWCLGHIVGSARIVRASLAAAGSAPA